MRQRAMLGLESYLDEIPKKHPGFTVAVLIDVYFGEAGSATFLGETNFDAKHFT